MNGNGVSQWNNASRAIRRESNRHRELCELHIPLYEKTKIIYLEFCSNDGTVGILTKREASSNDPYRGTLTETNVVTNVAQSSNKTGRLADALFNIEQNNAQVFLTQKQVALSGKSHSDTVRDSKSHGVVFLNKTNRDKLLEWFTTEPVRRLLDLKHLAECQRQISIRTVTNYIQNNMIAKSSLNTSKILYPNNIRNVLFNDYIKQQIITCLDNQLYAIVVEQSRHNLEGEIQSVKGNAFKLEWIDKLTQKKELFMGPETTYFGRRRINVNTVLNEYIRPTTQTEIKNDSWPVIFKVGNGNIKRVDSLEYSKRRIEEFVQDEFDSNGFDSDDIQTIVATSFCYVVILQDYSIEIYHFLLGSDTVIKHSEDSSDIGFMQLLQKYIELNESLTRY